MSKANEVKRTERLRALGVRGKVPGQLTESIIEAARTRKQSERYELVDGKVPGLSLRVGVSGAATFELHYRTKGGLRRRYKIATAGAVTLDDARALAMGVLAEVARGADPAGQEREALAESENVKTLRSYLEEIYEPEKLKHRKGKNGAIAKAHLLAAWEPLLDVQLSKLTRDAIEKVLAARKAAKRPDGSRLLKDGTLLRHWNPLRAMLAHAVDRGHLTALPLSGRPEPLRGLHDEPRIRWLGENDTEEEIAKGEGERARFFKALDAFQSEEPGGGDFLRCVVRLAVNTGMRRGEIVRLRDDMIKRGPDRIELPGAICKSAKGRKAYLNAAALEALKCWREVRKTLKVQSIAGELFPGEGKPDEIAERYEDRITQREFPRLCTQAGVIGLTFHSLRHTFAALLVKAGVPLIEVRDACGHASIVTTEKHYAHLAPSAVQRSVQALRVM